MKVNDFWETELVLDPKGNYVLMEDYVELERRHQTIMDAIENMGSLENIRRVEVSQPIVIDMARENAWMKGTINRLIEAGDAMADEIIGCYNAEGYDPADSETLLKWNAAKEGKPSV